MITIRDFGIVALVVAGLLLSGCANTVPHTPRQSLAVAETTWSVTLLAVEQTAPYITPAQADRLLTAKHVTEEILLAWRKYPDQASFGQNADTAILAVQGILREFNTPKPAPVKTSSVGDSVGFNVIRLIGAPFGLAL